MTNMQRPTPLRTLDQDSCDGCGMVDPCGVHYTDCTLLEPGDELVDRESGEPAGVYNGPCRACIRGLCPSTHD